jgi:hypothetical protein
VQNNILIKKCFVTNLSKQHTKKSTITPNVTFKNTNFKKKIEKILKAQNTNQNKK